MGRYTHSRWKTSDSIVEKNWITTLKNLRIKPFFHKQFLFIGVLPFEYHESGFFLVLLPTLGFVVRWDFTTDNLKEDLSKLDWTK